MKQAKISAFLIGGMLLSLLAGCGSSSGGNPVAEMQKNYDQYVRLGKYMGVEYTPQKTTVTDSDIQSDIDSLISDNSSTREVDRTATTGDTVNIDFTGYLATSGEAFEGGTATNTDVTIGSNTFISGFEDQLIGHSAGDAFNIDVTFPDNYGQTDLAGKPAYFETVVNSVKETVKPAYNDALVASATDYKTTKEYEKAMREKHVKDNEESDLSANKQTILQKVIDTATVTDYPEQELKDRIQQMTDSVSETAQSNNIDLETYLSYYGYTADTFQDQVRTSVESYIKEKMVVCKVAEEADITVTKKEADDEIQTLLSQSGLTDVKDLEQQYGYSDDDFYFIVLETKVMDYLYDNAVPVKASATDASATDSAE